VTNIILLGGKVGIWKQARELVIMSEPTSAAFSPLTLPAEKVIQGDIALGLMQTSLRSRLSRMPLGRHLKEEREEKRIGNFSLKSSSYQTGDAAFTPATSHDLYHSDSHKSHNTQHTRAKQNTLCFMQKDTQPSKTCS
jgi:hypothetical protein